MGFWGEAHMERIKLVRQPIILVASTDHVWHDEIYRRLDRLGAIVIPAAAPYEAHEFIECHSEKLDLVILEEPFESLLIELRDVHDQRPELRIIGCAETSLARVRLQAAGCTETGPLHGRDFLQRLQRIVEEIQGYLTVH